MREFLLHLFCSEVFHLLEDHRDVILEAYGAWGRGGGFLRNMSASDAQAELAPGGGILAMTLYCEVQRLKQIEAQPGSVLEVLVKILAVLVRSKVCCPSSAEFDTQVLYINSS